MRGENSCARTLSTDQATIVVGGSIRLDSRGSAFVGKHLTTKTDSKSFVAALLRMTGEEALVRVTEELLSG
jgi:hypothetical protein